MTYGIKIKPNRGNIMKRTLLSTGVIILFGLSACGGDLPGDVTVTDDTQEVVLEKPFVRVVFNPATADINLPNDFLMIPGGNFFDFTLNTEGADTFAKAKTKAHESTTHDHTRKHHTRQHNTHDL